MSDVIGDEINLRVEVENDDFLPMDIEVQGDEITTTVAEEEEEEEGEVSSLSDSPARIDMEVDNGMLADVESSPFRKFERRSKFQRSLSKLSSTDDNVPKPRQYPNPFKRDGEAKRRAERARRFQDSPFRLIEIDEKLTVTEQELLNLYKECGLFANDWDEMSLDKVGSQNRLDAILIRGINNMSTDEIFSYLYEMGLVPEAMEWVNDACCIVIYKDKYEAAASLLKVTKPISVDQKAVEKKKNLEIEEKPVPEDEEDKEKAETSSKSEDFEFEAVSTVPYDKVAVPMPLGYVWRYARPCEKTKGILMRFASFNDRKQENAMRYSEYYKKFGNPNQPNYRSNEEGPRRRKPSKRVRYNPSPEISSSEEDLKGTQKFNVWSKLSADWQDEEGRISRRDSNSNVRANTPIPKFNASSTRPSHFRRPNRDRDPDEEQYYRYSISRSSAFDKLDEVSPRKRTWYENEERPRRAFFTAGHNGEDEWSARLEGPTMRMRADIEESRQKLKATRRTPSKSPISSRLGDRVVETELSSPFRLSIKERLGVGAREAYVRSQDSGVGRGTDEDEDEDLEDDLQNLLQDDY